MRFGWRTMQAAESVDGGSVSRSWSIAAIAFVGGVGGGVVFPILPLIGIDLRISAFMVGLILSANRLTRLGFNPVTGSLLDRFGARWPVAAGLAIEALGTLAFSAALASTRPSAWFLTGRIVWGIGSSLLLVGTLTAVMAIAPADRRAGMVARVRTAISLGLPAGLVVGGLMADSVSANAAFLTATALSIAGALAAVHVLPAHVKAQTPAPRRDPERRWSDDWRALLRVPELRMIWGTNALLFFAMSGVLLSTLAIVVKQRSLGVFGFGAAGSAGLYMAAMMAARAGAALASGSYLDRVSSRTGLLFPAMLMATAGFLALAAARQVSVLAVGLLLVGAGSGGLTIPLLTLLGDASPRHLHGRALSIYQWSSDFGGALGPIAGLELGHAFGYFLTYAAVGLGMLLMIFPLRLLIARRKS